MQTEPTGDFMTEYHTAAHSEAAEEALHMYNQLRDLLRQQIEERERAEAAAKQAGILGQIIRFVTGEAPSADRFPPRKEAVEGQAGSRW